MLLHVATFPHVPQDRGNQRDKPTNHNARSKKLISGSGAAAPAKFPLPEVSPDLPCGRAACGGRERKFSPEFSFDDGVRAEPEASLKQRVPPLPWGLAWGEGKGVSRIACAIEGNQSTEQKSRGPSNICLIRMGLLVRISGNQDSFYYHRSDVIIANNFFTSMNYESDIIKSLKVSGADIKNE